MGKEAGRKEEEGWGEEGGSTRKAHFYFLGNTWFIFKTPNRGAPGNVKGLGSSKCLPVWLLSDSILWFLCNHTVNFNFLMWKTDNSSSLFSKTQHSSCPLTPPHFKAPDWHFQHTYRKSNLLCTPVYSARKPGVTESDFSTLTSNGENKYVLTDRKNEEAGVSCTYPFRRWRTLRASGLRMNLGSSMIQWS